jgi:malate dehydrogenase
MMDVAILGAGELGGSLAYVLARRDLARSIHLVDSKGQVAAGKALDIMQVGPIEGFASRVSGATDITSAGGADVFVVADQANGSEWSGDAGLQLLKQLTQIASGRIVICAGADQRSVIERGVRELSYRRARLLGTAPEALAAALRALVALAAGDSPRSVGLTLLGAPPHQAVVPWEDVTVGGRPIVRALDEPTRRKLAARVAPLWPPGPYALANAAAEAIAAIGGRSSRVISAFVAPDDSAGTRSRATALPVRLGSTGIVRVELPSLSATAQVALDNAMAL